MGENKNATLTSIQRQRAHDAAVIWSKFLLNEMPNPREFEQHLFFLGDSKFNDVGLYPRNFNRFMAGTVMFDIMVSHSSLMTFAKLGPVIIFGHIQCDGAKKWDGTKVHVRHGNLAKRSVLPPEILNFLKEKSSQSFEAIGKISSAQQEKIQNEIRDNIEAFSGSPQFRSIMADAEAFGVSAVICKDKRR